MHSFFYARDDASEPNATWASHKKRQLFAEDASTDGAIKNGSSIYAYCFHCLRSQNKRTTY